MCRIHKSLDSKQVGECIYADYEMCGCITAGGLQRMTSLLTPSYRMQIGAISIHPVIVLITPTIKVNLK